MICRPPPTIAILLATYQGERFLTDFLGSVRRQTFENWQLIARDDGSADGSRELLLQAAACDSRISLLPSGGRLGAAQSFGALAVHAAESRHPYAAFADQDDCWRDDKLATQIAAMHRLEARFGADRPLLVHSDLAVIDSDGRTIAESYEDFAKLRRPRNGDLSSRLITNDVAGCSILANLALIRTAAPLPQTIVMHDWWLALCAAAVGHIEYINEPLVRYRLHEANTVGGATPWRRLFAACVDGGRRWQKIRDDFLDSVLQAKSLSQRVGLSLSAADAQKADLLEEYRQIMEHRGSRLRRTWKAYGLKRRSMHPLRELALLAKIFTFDVDAYRARLEDKKTLLES